MAPPCLHLEGEVAPHAADKADRAEVNTEAQCVGSWPLSQLQKHDCGSYTIVSRYKR
jgi:hypothetical protein